MAYTRTAWVDDTTPLSAANLNNMESGIWQAVGLSADYCIDSNITITAPPTTFDGITPSSLPGTRLLLVGQTNGRQNGLWQHNGAGNALTRPAEFATTASVPDGLSIFVKNGNRYGGSRWTLNQGSALAAPSSTVDTSFLVPERPAQTADWAQYAGTGGFGTTNPGAGVGWSFTVPTTGVYSGFAWCTAYATVANSGATIHAGFDGGDDASWWFFFNQANVHAFAGMQPIAKSLAAGMTHNFALWTVGANITSNNDDRGGFIIFRTA